MKTANLTCLRILRRLYSSSRRDFKPSGSVQRMTAESAQLQAVPLAANIFDSFKKEIVDLPEVSLIKNLFASRGFELRVAGGAVRDLLRGEIPHDVDFATTATPEQMISLMSPLSDTIRLITTKAGERHGTVTARINDNDRSQFEITTLRIDKLTDGRHAEVEFTLDWKLDASRRDLTINAMFLDLDGMLYDYFGGLEDLRHQRVRFVGNPVDRIQEDYLRIFRYFRFYARYGYASPHEPETLKAIADNVDGLANISGERIWSEMKRILPLNKSNLVIPVIMNDVGIARFMGFDDRKHDLVEFHKAHSRLFSESATDDDKLFSVVLFSSLIGSDDEFFNVVRRLRFSNTERDCANYIRANMGSNLPITSFKRQLILASRSAQSAMRKFVIEFLRYTGRHSEVPEIRDFDIPHFPLRGDVVGKMLVKKRDTGRVMEALTLIWADSGCAMSADDLEAEVPNVAKELKIPLKEEDAS